MDDMRKVIMVTVILASACPSVSAASLDGLLIARECLRLGSVLSLDVMCALEAAQGETSILALGGVVTLIQGLPSVFVLGALANRDPRALAVWRGVELVSDAGSALVMGGLGAYYAYAAAHASRTGFGNMDSLLSAGFIVLAAALAAGALIDTVPYSIERPPGP
jgi:hypothetical protein